MLVLAHFTVTTLACRRSVQFTELFVTVCSVQDEYLW